MKTNLLMAVIGFSAATVFATKPQTKSWVNKDARFFVQHYEQTDHTTHHVREDFLSGDFWMDDNTQDSVLNWDDGKGGKQTWNLNETGDDTYNGPSSGSRNTLNTWPATWWPNLVNGTFVDSPLGSSDDGSHQPYIIFQHRDQKTKQDYSFADPGGYGYPYDPFDGPYIEEGHLTGAPHTQVVLKFYAGGKGLPKRPSVYQGSVSAVAHKQTGVIGVYNTPVYDSTPIASQNITLGDLGQLDPDGILYAKIDDGSTKDITPKVADVDYYTFAWPVLTKYTLMSQVSCQALTDTNLDRTSLGVAETVSLGTLPAETKWNTSAGTLSVGQGGQGSSTYFYAPHTAGSAKVTATIRKVSLSIDFKVLEPTGVDHADFVEYWTYNSTSQAGAGIHLRPYIGPTSVSFSAVQIMEVGEDASDIQGYFKIYAPPSHTGNGADVWINLGCDNSWQGDYDWAKSWNWSSPWFVSGSSGFSGGSYTWDIPAKWRVGNGSEHSMAGWNQIHTLSPNGTMSVTKFGHTVSRTINNIYSNQ